MEFNDAPSVYNEPRGAKIDYQVVIVLSSDFHY